MSKGKEKLDAEIASLAVTLAQTPDDHPTLSLLLACLQSSHTQRFEVCHDLTDLDKAIEYGSIALTLTADDDPRMLSLLYTQTAAYQDRFPYLSELDDINKAIEYGNISVTLTPEGHPRLHRHLMNLGASYGIRFQYQGNLDDLEDAIEYQSSALALAPENSPDLPTILDSIGVSQTERFQRRGGLDDLDNAIAYMTRGVSLSPDDDPAFPRRLTNLGLSHTIRFERLGEMIDCETAIKYQSCALALIPEDDPRLPDIFMNLAASHNIRFVRQGHLNDLENAIEHLSHAVALTPEGDPDLSFRLANLGDYCVRRFQCLDEPNDLENAIEYQSRALALASNRHPDLPKMHANLAVSYMDRFRRQGELSDLEAVVHFETRALALTPSDHPDSAKWQFNHGTTQFLYYQHTGDTPHLLLALDLFRRASKSLCAPPHMKFKSARAWATVATAFDPIEAYQTAIDLLPQVIWLGSTTSQRYDDLSNTGTLAVEAASAAIRSSKYGLALEWLEHTRCVVWNQHLMLRSPVDQLLLANSNLAIQLQAVATRLHSAGSETREAQVVASGSLTAENLAQEHRQLARDYDNLLARIRQLEGFEDFLRPMKADSLVHAVRTGPVVVINCDEEGCDALIIRPGKDEVHHVGLPGFSTQKAQEARRELEISLRAKGVRERGVKVLQPSGRVVSMESVLAKLWYNIVKPILEFLGCMANNPNEDLPHITWCPTSALSFLPLHAAGDYNQSRSRVFDFVISSYTPTLTALLTSAASSLNTDCRVLVIGQAATPGRSPLPGTKKEISYIRSHTDGNSNYSQLLDHQATVPAVLDAMEQHDWVHLACHAHQNVMDPTKSGFFLHDGTLDLAAINRRSFKGKGLAFLSACQTATGDEKLADEAVHLASGMLMAGYTSVIGTMWSVHDKDAPLVADRVYAQLMKDRKLGNGEAGRALHHALACLRETVGEQRFERWVPYIHIGS
ncbi:unnamed protein product [Rhizoctonia solani]|uniref:CHAT domain-containing protein n=1 Tax=Rhizoctonia solani TaxID=456999 RepID=A0A8H3HWY8_9AGAM|nr:unnamed protein product [Rhizoctonia solani]